MEQFLKKIRQKLFGLRYLCNFEGNKLGVMSVDENCLNYKPL